MESLYQIGVCTWSPFTKWECAHGVPLPNGSVHMESFYQMGVCTWSPFTKWECAHGVPLTNGSVSFLYQFVTMKNITGSVSM